MSKNKLKKVRWKAGNMVYPLPAVMVSCGDESVANIVTVAWTGTICTNPPMTYISLRPERYSYDVIKRTGVFVINLTTEDLVRATDFCGVKSGRDLDKFTEMGLTMERDEDTHCPMIVESPVSIVCETTDIKELGSHHMFIAHVKAVYVDERYMNEKGKFELNHTGLMAYSHGSYLSLGKELGTFGYSISKKHKPMEEKQKKGIHKDIRSKKARKTRIFEKQGNLEKTFMKDGKTKKPKKAMEKKVISSKAPLKSKRKK